MPSLFRPGGIERGVKRRYFEILLIVSAVLLILSIVFAALYFGNSTSDTRLGDVFLERLRQENRLARDYASQLSRLGGSTTRHLLALTRQHLYGISQISELSVTLLGASEPPVSPQTLTAAMDSLTACEDLINGGSPIDEPMAALWVQLDIINSTIADLG